MRFERLGARRRVIRHFFFGGLVFLRSARRFVFFSSVDPSSDPARVAHALAKRGSRDWVDGNAHDFVRDGAPGARGCRSESLDRWDVPLVLRDLEPRTGRCRRGARRLFDWVTVRIRRNRVWTSARRILVSRRRLMARSSRFALAIFSSDGSVARLTHCISRNLIREFRRESSRSERPVHIRRSALGRSGRTHAAKDHERALDVRIAQDTGSWSLRVPFALHRLARG